MRQLGIQIVLIVGLLAIAWRLLISYGQRAQAMRRLGLLAFAGFAVWSILDPGGLLTDLASLLGVGRAADLVLYGLVLAFLGFVVTSFRRFRDLETRYTRLARRIALDESEPAARRGSLADAGPSAVLGHADSEASPDSKVPNNGPRPPIATDAD